uniref:Uncharacterized protein n=1 Tax=Anopheles coluzzii TaxID=1518534 RepID=A0A8W7P8X6_ANOCL
MSADSPSLMCRPFTVHRVKGLGLAWIVMLIVALPLAGSSSMWICTSCWIVSKLVPSCCSSAVIWAGFSALSSIGLPSSSQVRLATGSPLREMQRAFSSWFARKPPSMRAVALAIFSSVGRGGTRFRSSIADSNCWPSIVTMQTNLPIRSFVNVASRTPHSPREKSPMRLTPPGRTFAVTSNVSVDGPGSRTLHWSIGLSARHSRSRLRSYSVWYEGDDGMSLRRKHLKLHSIKEERNNSNKWHSGGEDGRLNWFLGFVTRIGLRA